MAYEEFQTEDALYNRLDKAINKIVSAKDAQTRSQARANVRMMMRQHARGLEEPKRLAWLQRGQQAFMKSLFQETGSYLHEGMRELTAFTNDRGILSALPRNHVAAYATPVRDTLLSQAEAVAQKDVQLFFAMQMATELTNSPDIIGAIPTEQRLAYATPMLTSCIDMVARHSNSRGNEYMPTVTMHKQLKDKGITGYLSDADHAAYVTSGMSLVIAVHETLVEQDDQEHHVWRAVINSFVRDHLIAPHISENVLKKAGYLTLDVDAVQDMQIQTEVMLDFLGNQPQEKRNEYAALMADKADAIKTEFAEGKIGVTDIEEPGVLNKAIAYIQNKISSYGLLKKTLKHERLSGGSEPV